jgi:hypothetical protein
MELHLRLLSSGNLYQNSGKVLVYGWITIIFTKKKIEKAINNGGKVNIFAPYFLDFSPIDNVGSKLKYLLCSQSARNYQVLKLAIASAHLSKLMSKTFGIGLPTAVITPHLYQKGSLQKKGSVKNDGSRPQGTPHSKEF